MGSSLRLLLCVLVLVKSSYNLFWHSTVLATSMQLPWPAGRMVMFRWVDPGAFLSLFKILQNLKKRKSRLTGFHFKVVSPWDWVFFFSGWSNLWRWSVLLLWFVWVCFIQQMFHPLIVLLQWSLLSLSSGLMKKNLLTHTHSPPSWTLTRLYHQFDQRACACSESTHKWTKLTKATQKKCPYT